MIKLAFDVMGSDSGPKDAVIAALNFLKDKDDLKIVFYGDKESIEKVIAESKLEVSKEQYEIHPTTQVIAMDGSILDVRRKKDASIVQSLQAVKNKEVDAMLTGGSSAAFIAGAQMIIGTIDNVERAGFMPTMPTAVEGKLAVLIDAGANLDNKPEDLVNYAKMASVYLKNINNVAKPIVGLMNIGEEAKKGKDLQKEAYQLMTEDEEISFYGNIESKDLISGLVDIIVADGYTGNIALKSMEGALKNILTLIKKELTRSIWTKIAALPSLKTFKKMGRKYNPKNYAGAILLGIDGIVFKSHGSSDVKAFSATLRMTYAAVKNNVLEELKKGMAKL